MSNVVYYQFRENANGSSNLFSERQLKNTMKARRMEKNKMYRFENIAKERLKDGLGKTKVFISNSKDFFLRHFDLKEEIRKEIVIQVNVAGGQTIKMLTGEYCFDGAAKHIRFALDYTKENIGEPIAWSFEGEEIVRSPFQHKPKKLKDKVLDFFGLY